MKSVVISLGLFLAMPGGFLFAQAVSKPASSPASPAAAVPLIERELFFDNPEIAGGQLSPDGKMISFLKANKGIMNIWVKKIDEPFSKAKPVTASEEPLGGYFWTRDGKYILFVHAVGGNENYHIYAVDPQAEADSSTGVPVSRNLTPIDSVRAIIFNVSRKNPDVLWIGLNNRDLRWHDLYKLEISTGKLTLLRENKDRFSAVYFDWDENLRLATRSAEDGSTEILRMNSDGSSTKIYGCSQLEHCSPDAFTSDNKWFYLETNKGDSQNLIKLTLFNPETMESKDVEQDPLNKVDFGSLSVSEQTREPIFSSYTDAKRRLYWKDTSYEADYNFLQKKFPGKQIDFYNSTTSERQYLIGVSSDDKLPEVYYFDRDSKSLLFQYSPRSKLKAYEKYFVKMQPVSYPSSDSLEIPGYLSLPKGVAAKKLPLIVFPHGGPWARDQWGFNGYVQWLCNRGYAVLQMNFRGSTGYGKDFLNAGNKQWGMLMQDDISWGVKYLVSKGIADPKRVGIMGASYGGYAVLAGLSFTPDMYAAGVDIVGPSNLVTLLNSIPPYWEAARKIFYLRMGDPSIPEGKAQMEKQSPLFSASKITAPILIIQGLNDPRVKKAESDQIVVALRDLGRSVEYIVAPDEGHGFLKPINNLAAFGKAEVFLGKNLHARYQLAMKPDAKKRLEEITVDVSTVKLTPKLTVTTLNPLPAPAADLKEGSYSYKVTVQIGSRQIPLNMSCVFKSDSLHWLVTEKVTSAMGNQTDEAVYAKQTLVPLSRKSTQGPNSVSLQFNGKEISTTIAGKTTTSTAEGAYLIDGAGFDFMLARLPITDGYDVGLNIVDQQGKSALHEFKITGKDTVNGVNCYVAELINAENPKDITKMWINADEHMTYKMEIPLAAIPGSKMIVELKK